MIADRVWDGVAVQSQLGTAVILRGNQIEAVCPIGDVPDGITRHPYPNCTLLPGLIDAHVHYSDVFGPAFLAAGVTTVRDVGNGLDWILERRARHAADPSLGPKIVCCGLLIDGAPAFWQRIGREHADADSVRRTVREEAGRGVDQIKLYAALRREQLSAGVDEAHRQGKFVLAHLGSGISADDVVDLGLDETEHLTGCEAAWRASTTDALDQMIDRLLAGRVIMNPTLVVWDRLGRLVDHAFNFDTRRRWMPQAYLDIWKWYPRVHGQRRMVYQTAVPCLKRGLRRMHERGVRLGLGTDTPFPHLVPGFSVHDELAMYVDCGIPPVDALRSATSINAGILGKSGRIGQIAAGFEADVLIVQGDPLQDIDAIANVHSVWRQGRAIDLAAQLARAQATAATVPEDPITQALLIRVPKSDGPIPPALPAAN